MDPWFRMAFGFIAVFLATGTVQAQERIVSNRSSSPHRVGYRIPAPVIVSNTQPMPSWSFGSAVVYPGRSTPSGLIETAARRINPFSSASRAWDVSFAPSPYRQPPETLGVRVMRPAFGTPGYQVLLPTSGSEVPSTQAMPGVNCPTCPR